MCRVSPAVRRVVRLVAGWTTAVAVLASLTYVVVDLAEEVVGQGVSAGVPGAPDVVAGGPSASGGESSGAGPSATGPGADGGATPAPGDDGRDPGTSGPDPSGPAGPGAPSRSTPSTPEPGASTPGTAGPAPSRTSGGRPTTPGSPGTPTRPGSTGTPSTPTPDPTTPDPTPTPTPSPTPTRTSSFTTDGGTATVACRGRVVQVRSITARDGWRFEDKVVTARSQVVVTFTRSADGTYVTLEVTCVGGQPRKTGQGSGKGKKPVADEPSARTPGGDEGEPR